MKGCDSSCQEPHHKRSLSRNPSCRHHQYYHSYKCSHPSANYMPPSGSQYTDRFCKDTVFTLECSIIACILIFIIFFIIGIKCTFPARHQKRKSPARRPGGFEIRRKKRFDLLKPGDLQSPNNNPEKHKQDVADCKSAKPK